MGFHHLLCTGINEAKLLEDPAGQAPPVLDEPLSKVMFQFLPQLITERKLYGKGGDGGMGLGGLMVAEKKSEHLGKRPCLLAFTLNLKEFYGFKTLRGFELEKGRLNLGIYRKTLTIVSLICGMETEMVGGSFGSETTALGGADDKLVESWDSLSGQDL
uniref:Uncharacterized protein n=1 Tax=Parascaris univalens TaxID=6257 RepID=A0A915CJI6_PARUN